MKQLGDRQAHIWLLFLDDSDEQRLLISSCHTLLDTEERRRWERFRFPGDRQQYLAGHALLRVALSHYGAVDPRDWRFRSGAYGKPEIAGPTPVPPLRFSLSHTRGLAACLVASLLDVGLDVEEMRAGTDLWETAGEFLTSQELADCHELPPELQRGRLYECWTLKEAYVKGCGRGLSLPLSAIAFRLEPGGSARVSFGPGIGDVSDRWQFFLSEPSPAHKLAAAIRRGDGRDAQVAQRSLSAGELVAAARH